MLFNSFEYLIFLPIIFALYWSIKSNKIQNLLIVAASYLFYGWWDYRFLALIIFSSVVDYFVGLQMVKSETVRKKVLLWTSLTINLGLLGVFKYYNFFVESFVDAFLLFGVILDPFTLNIILPVGISFYTFQTLSYSIDVYRGNLKPTKDFTVFAAYVSFFPQLVAGPIERATNLLPQFQKSRKFSYEDAKDGILQICWGLFKKVVIADNCATIANFCFANYTELSSIHLAIGIICFAFQIYGDFSGYSDIAIGTAKLFGFSLMRNFAYPYFSRDMAEFWRRWHISLSTWFRDYLYIPLGGSRGSRNMKLRNTMIIFVVSGFWHGANWTFLIWGALNGLYFLPLLLSNNNRRNLGTVAEGKLFITFRDLRAILMTFSLTCIAWIFFRADSVTEAVNYIIALFSFNFTGLPEVEFVLPMLSILLLVFIEWLQRDKLHPLQLDHLKSRWLRYSFYLAIVTITIIFGNYGGSSFIYFQF
jgi:alginate O-acetyltransferase complex protein AlgI